MRDKDLGMQLNCRMHASTLGLIHKTPVNQLFIRKNWVSHSIATPLIPANN